jgi:hypothetical protein
MAKVISEALVILQARGFETALLGGVSSGHSERLAVLT